MRECGCNLNLRRKNSNRFVIRTCGCKDYSSLPEIESVLF